MTKRVVGAVACCLGWFAAAWPALAQWKPAENPLMTRWSEEVSPERAHGEYPRPQLAREAWTNLNGLWDYAIAPREQQRPAAWDGKILVPFPVESALSGVKRSVGPENRLWCRRSFRTPREAQGKRLLLHFGGVDWRAEVYLNGALVGQHQGGYDPFSFDITDQLKAEGEQELVVGVWDPVDQHWQPRGKQVAEPRGIWYTSVTGIWQTVWLEPVAEARVQSLKITPDVDGPSVEVTVSALAPPGAVDIALAVLDQGREVRTGRVSIQRDGGQREPVRPTLKLPVPDAKLWSPDSPFLYDLRVTLAHNGRQVDRVDSYFGMRKISVGKDKAGFNRLLLNNQPLFQLGPLDQGWWPDGLYTAPTDAALRYDIETLKKLGFNMMRKHVKVEPLRFYYHCDKLGLLVWQDMPNGDKHVGREGADLERSPESAENFWREYQALIDAHYNHPCIVAWVPFNEGWGQFQTEKVIAWTRRYDPSRLVDGPSGWADRGVGDMHDMHRYPGPAMPEPEPDRAVVLGEFGGLGLPLAGHLWWDKRNWGYRTYQTREELQANYERLIRNLRPLIGAGLAAAVYTQTTDVEGEVNGLMTYDRKVVKFDVERLQQLHAPLYLPQPLQLKTVVLPTSREEGRAWRYTTEKPAGGWEQPGFDDSAWRTGPGGFGAQQPPNAVIRTPWNSPDIWLRREFQLAGPLPANPHLRIYHDEDAEVYINGRQAASLPGYVTDYTDVELDEAAKASLREGPNLIAVHCRQTTGGQNIDVGLVEVTEKMPE